MQKEKIVIWGTGRFGELAYYYYKETCDLLFFVDSNTAKWGTFFCNVPVNSPKKLEDMSVKVVLAFQSGKDSVKKILETEYGITDIIEFSVNETDITKQEADDIDANSIIVYASGGLGNQLFQYALLYAFICEGKKALMDISYYKNAGVMNFCLDEAFRIDELIVLDKSISDKTIKEKIWDSNESINYLIYKEPTIFEESIKKVKEDILNIGGGYLKGMFQTRYFAEKYKIALLESLKFREIPDGICDEFNKYKNEYNLVSVHIRRGDYLSEANQRIYGEICTEEYYERAIDYIIEHEKNVIFCFFSDDIEYVKERYNKDNYIFWDKKDIDNYQDWYDLFFMSQCNHNIIANSTFSWWGAMLNKNQDKKVVAPKKWINYCEYIDIYPREWIVL